MYEGALLESREPNRVGRALQISRSCCVYGSAGIAVILALIYKRETSAGAYRIASIGNSTAARNLPVNLSSRSTVIQCLGECDGGGADLRFISKIPPETNGLQLFPGMSNTISVAAQFYPYLKRFCKIKFHGSGIFKAEIELDFSCSTCLLTGGLTHGRLLAALGSEG